MQKNGNKFIGSGFATLLFLTAMNGYAADMGDCFVDDSQTEKTAVSVNKESVSVSIPGVDVHVSNSGSVAMVSSSVQIAANTKKGGRPENETSELWANCFVDDEEDQ